MPYTFPPDIRELVDQQIANGNYTSEDEVLRVALASLADQEADLAAVQEAISAWEQGDSGSPFEEAFERIRTKHGIDSNA